MLVVLIIGSPFAIILTIIIFIFLLRFILLLLFLLLLFFLCANLVYLLFDIVSKS
ncbi:hypothetical protein MtrunA17_Chr7g0264581 [Medicago truncatula]|uniref:Transmembrane protein n=1 Tax=Medicago truncatula TaxID=3880 RepID=A0A396H6W5_MEDTR|nr:hypothetical protein MtrunA17_Chr7g0264581 [Medicago truncatula]